LNNPPIAIGGNQVRDEQFFVGWSLTIRRLPSAVFGKPVTQIGALKMSSVVEDVYEKLEVLPEFVSVLAAREPAALLSLDVGTSGVRAALFDDQGREIEGASAHANRIFATFADVEELDPDDLIELVGQTIDQLFDNASQSIDRVKLIAASCFWHSLMGVGADGRPTTPVLGWANTRAGSAADQLRALLDEREIHVRTGCRLHPSYWPAKLLWLKKERADDYKATKHWLSFADYLVLRLFGETATSVSMASGSGLMDQRSCAWDQPLLETLELPPETLPEIAVADRTFAGLRAEFSLRWPQLNRAAMLPPIADGAANSIGSGCTTRDKIALMVGTSGAMRVMYEGEPASELPTALWSYRADRRRVIAGGALSDGGALFGWMRQTLSLRGDNASVERQLEEIEADSHGLTVLPFWAGERSSGWTTNARGGILGVTLHTRPIEILRAAMEAVAYRFALIAEVLESFAPGATVVASGNALRASAVWSQMIADVLGRPMQLSAIGEASTRGAALLALEQMGKIDSIEESETPAEKTFVPDTKRHERYREGLERQERIYEKLIE
jgi:gluconokinase